MDGQRFDKLARLLAGGSDRRGFLKRVAGVAAGAAIVTGPGRVLAQNGAETTLGYGDQCYTGGDPCDAAKHLECVVPDHYYDTYGEYYDAYDPNYGYYDYGTGKYYPYGTCECTDTYTYNADKGYCWADDSVCYANEDCNTKYYGDYDKYVYHNGKYYEKYDTEYTTPLPVYECIYGVCHEVPDNGNGGETPPPHNGGNGGHTPPPHNGGNGDKAKKARLRRLRRRKALRRRAAQRRNR